MSRKRNRNNRQAPDMCFVPKEVLERNDEYVRSLETALRSRAQEVKTLKARVDVLECEQQEIIEEVTAFIMECTETWCLIKALAERPHQNAGMGAKILEKFMGMEGRRKSDEHYIHSDKSE